MVNEELSEKEKIFCLEYIVDFNGARAAIAAGYSKKSARSIASQTLTKLNIQNYISVLIKKRQEEVEFDANEVLRRLAILARGNLRRFVKPNPDGSGFNVCIDKDELTDDDMYCLSEITTEEYMEGHGEEAKPIRKTKIKLVDRLKALELAGKHTDVQAFVENHKHDVGGNLESFLKLLNGGGDVG